MIFSVHSLYILVYDSFRRCLYVRPSAADCEPERGRGSLTNLLEWNDSGAEMNLESNDEEIVESRSTPCSERNLQGNSSDSAFYHEETGIKFSTPVYIQRYCAVIDAICDPRWKDAVKNVVDMGCSEFGFFVHMKNALPDIAKIVAVDVDLFMLESFCWKVAPLTTEYLCKRSEELNVIVMKGSVSQFDSCLEGSDAVVCIELIEHLHPLELDDLPYVVFGQVQPRIAVFTTPNSDFNVLFNNPSKRFRHPDHKFEWSRSQFQDWARNITKRFPKYKVEFSGIGKGPKGTEESHGSCSQMALFFRDEGSIGPSNTDEGKESNYQLVKHVVYPKKEPCDEAEEIARKAKCKAEYHIHALARDSSYDEPSGDTLIPLSTILQFVDEYFSDEECLRSCLESHNWKVESNSAGQPCIKYVNQCSDDSEFSDDADVDGVHFESCHYTRGPFSDMDMAETAPRPWQSEPHLQAAFPFARHNEAPAAESLMFRSVNERQIFGYKSSMSDPIRVDDSGYPNSASVQDMDVTLGSSDDLSPSNGEEEDLEEEEEEPIPRILIPPPPFFPPAPFPANNHDAVNNNRDDEGNDLGLELVQVEQQPMPRPPEFPRWLLFVLADDRDEGFADESSSSEDD